MSPQLIPTLIESVDRFEEGTRIRGMNRNRDAELPGGVPHWIEPGIVNADQRPPGDFLPEIQTERLQDLQAFCAGLYRRFDLIRLVAGVIGLVDAAPSRLGENKQAIRVRLLMGSNRLSEKLPVASRQVHKCPDVCRIHSG